MLTDVEFGKITTACDNGNTLNCTWRTIEHFLDSCSPIRNLQIKKREDCAHCVAIASSTEDLKPVPSRRRRPSDVPDSSNFKEITVTVP